MSAKLKHLRLERFANVGDKELIEAVKKLPFLEELQLVFSISSKTIEAIGNSCPSLKSFSLYKDDWRRYDRPSNEDALAIAKSMPNLHHLQLIGISVSNEGLEAILNGCPLLESLDVHVCFYNDLSGDLHRRYEELIRSQHLVDSCKDYGRSAYDKDQEYYSDGEYDYHVD